MVIFVRDSFLSQITNIDKDRMSSGDLGNKGKRCPRYPQQWLHEIFIGNESYTLNLVLFSLRWKFLKDNGLSNQKNLWKDNLLTISYLIYELGKSTYFTGGVAIRFELYRTGICFICSHFASHINNVEARNADFKNILNQIHFKENDKLIPDHDLIFWFGDLNYRFDKLSRDSVIELINRKGYDILLQHDQLKKILIQSETIFPSFKEAEICFKPTYKYVPGTLYTFSEHRTPAYCDRILWRGKDKVALMMSVEVIGPYSSLWIWTTKYLTF